MKVGDRDDPVEVVVCLYGTKEGTNFSMVKISTMSRKVDEGINKRDKECPSVIFITRVEKRKRRNRG